MRFNGKVCFRFYVAELEDYYDVDSRKLSLDLLNGCYVTNGTMFSSSHTDIYEVQNGY